MISSGLSHTTRKGPPKHLTLPKNDSRQPLTLTRLLLHSPLLSPALPSILPRHGKKPPRLNSRRIVRYLCWLAILTTVVVLVRSRDAEESQLGSLRYENANGEEYELLGAEELPEHATPVAITDRAGKAKWTVSVPTGLAHPLSPTDYIDICSHTEDVSQHVAHVKHHRAAAPAWHIKDPNFIDLPDARSAGLLPSIPPTFQDDLPLCERSLTYVLDASEAGLGHTLLGMWMSWALARREDRAFFLDEANFPFGNFTSLFGAAPEQPRCRLPSWEQRTPCPRQAKHLIVGAATLGYTFGQAFREQHGVEEIFQMAREGYEALFRLKNEDEKYVSSRLKYLHSLFDGHRKLIGVHIRRGDRHPWEFQYQHGYIPSDKYMAVAREVAKGHGNSTIVLASDDADLYHQTEVDGSIRAQEHIQLASKRQLLQGGLGWEGGFFSDAFWSVGVPEQAAKKRSVGSPQPTQVKQSPLNEHQYRHKTDDPRDYRSNPTPETRQLREYVGRAYLLDLAVLAGSDSVVCAVSSTGCRILAVMMGWNKLHGGHWNNVDGDYGWSGL